MAAEQAPVEVRVGPRYSVERQLRSIWADLLGHHDFGVHDVFFDVGGDSLLALRMLTHVRRRFGFQVAFDALLQAPTIAGVATLLRGDATGSGSVLVPLQARGSRPPLFCFHPIGGSVARYFALAAALGDEQPLYGLQSAGLVDPARARGSIAEMARGYLDEIRTVQPDGPYQLLGYSMGGMIAYEVAQQLHAHGQRAELYLVDTSAIPEDNADEGSALHAVANYAMKLDIDTGHLADLPLDVALTHLHTEAVTRGLFQPDFPLDWLVAVYHTVAANLRALAAYEPRPWPGSMVLFDAGGPGAAGADLGWGPLVGSLAVHRLGLGHFVVMEEKGIRRIAAVLRERLAQPGR